MEPTNNKPGADDKQSGRATHFLLWWAFAAFVIYLLPFIALTIDEVVLHTNWFSKHLPAWAGEVMRAAYPFHRIFSD